LDCHDEFLKYFLQELRLSYKNSSVGYYRIGNGPKPVFCFHGYGESGRSFQFLDELSGNEFTYYAIDLPFHGTTEWKEGLNFSKKDLVYLINEIRLANKIVPDQKFLTMGFSLGGRIALCLYQTIPEQIGKVILLAPDGLKQNFWYWVATQTGVGNRFFRFTMKNPGWFFEFLKLINKLGLVNSSIFKFVNAYINDKGIRKLLYQRWTTFRKLTPQVSMIKSFIKKFKTPFRLIYGIHDRIILPASGRKFQSGIEGYCSLLVIHSGHQVLHEKHAAEILPALLQ
jgi:pimeloyl-ACP methyl ester carboxylesterase